MLVVLRSGTQKKSCLEGSSFVASVLYATMDADSTAAMAALEKGFKIQGSLTPYASRYADSLAAVAALHAAARQVHSRYARSQV